MRLYLRSRAVISAQEDPHRLRPLGENTNVRAVDPDYSRYIPRSTLRRMDRTSRFGLYAAHAATDPLDEPQLDGIVIGVGQTFNEPAAKMLRTLQQHDEGMANPTVFMNSLLSTAGGHVALQFGCSGYNNTFTQRGFSFESALMDVAGRLTTDPGQQYFVAGIDTYGTDYPELAATYGHVSSTTSPTRQIGEGAAAFVVGGRPSPGDLAVIERFRTCFLADGQQDAVTALRATLEGDAPPELVLSGRPLHGEAARTYDCLDAALPPEVPRLPYKAYCGEYMTASAYGLATATGLLTGSLTYPGQRGPAPRSVLVINSYGQHYFSFMYLKAPRP